MKHNSIAPLLFISPSRRTLTASFIALSCFFAMAAFSEPVGTSFTYQGQLRRGGTAYNGTCDFQFSLWNAGNAGIQQGSTLPVNGVNVLNGLFTVMLDFGDRFNGDARWLATSVQCSGDGGFTELNPRQPMTATPYALSLRPGSRIEGAIPQGSLLTAVNLSTTAGSAGLYGITGAAGSGVYGNASGGNAAGVFGVNPLGAGIWGQSTHASGVYGESAVGRGVFGKSTGGVGVYGESDADSNRGVYGKSNGGSFSAGVYGENTAGAGVWGQSFGNGSAVYGENRDGGFAGRFRGPVFVEGNMTVTGTLQKPAGSFRIDHPLDPATKFLSHSFVESPDMMNIYNGNVTTDAAGNATVTLPDYFAALNRDCRYQLTVVGQFAQAIVSRKVEGNRFEIRTDKPGVEVSWQVTGIRQDAYAKAHPIVVEEFKPAEQQGQYLFPAGFGADEAKGIGGSSRPATRVGDEK